MVVAQTQTGVVALLLCKGSFGNIAGGFKDLCRYIGTSMAVVGLCVFIGVCGGLFVGLVVANTALMHEGGGTTQTPM